MEILNMDQVDLLSSDVVGLVGVPVEISTTAAFETAELIFYYDEASLGDTAEEDLSMLWYDEANNRYQMLDCTVDTQNNCVSYTTTHFSTYMLVDSREWSFAWQMTNISEGSFGEQGEQGVDIVIIVEDSLSLSSTRTSLLQSSLLKFVDSMQEGDEAAIVSYNGQTLIWSQFSGNKVSLKNKIASLDANTGVDEAKGLAKAVELLAARDNEKPKVILFISNGYFHVVEDTINACISHKFPVYSVSLLGYGSSNAVFVPATQPTGYTNLIKLSQLTGGICYKGELGGWQDTLMPKLHRETANSPQKEDTDGDGLCDVYETAGMILANGRIIHTDPHKADTDGDGLTDYEEAGILYTSDHKYIRTDGQEDYLKYYVMRSNPTLADTDGDGIPDGSDPHPWLKEEEWVARLDNRYLGVRYLRIKRTDGSFAHGGNQGWWKDKAYEKWQLDVFDSDYSKYYRMVNLGCGVVAMCDMELYMAQQNPGYRVTCVAGPYNPELSLLFDDIVASYDTTTGIIQETDYMKYVEYGYKARYWIPNTDMGYLIGVKPADMVGGIKQFLEFNNSPFDTVEWAPYFVVRKSDQKEMVLDTISFMLQNDIPVVFSYYNPSNRIDYYSHLGDAKTKTNPVGDGIGSHYMTITGLYKYLDDSAGSSLHYEYVLEVVTWEEVYYIRYSEYADDLSYVSNILSVH